MLTGNSLLDLRKQRDSKYAFNADGTVIVYRKVNGKWVPYQNDDKYHGHPDLWRVLTPNTLQVRHAIPPMPDYGEPDWFYEEELFDVLELESYGFESDCLAFTNKYHGGELIWVMRREIPDPWVE